MKYHGSIRNGEFTLTRESGEPVVLPRIERTNPTLGAKPPKGAVVLFDGRSADQWQNGKVVDGYLQASDCMTKRQFTDYSLHLEFRTPYMPFARGQKRGNSGVYHSGRWETQVLDSFGLESRDNHCGGIYSVSKPRLNMCLPPLAWQTYDVDFKAARFDARGSRIAWPKITVRLNGVLIHEDLELKKDFTTSAPLKAPLSHSEGPIFLQDHNDPVVYRNIWVTTPSKSESSDHARISFGMGKVELADEKTVDGRTVLRYEHDSHPDWGYAEPQRDYFNVVPASNVKGSAPLRVILHGAGASGDMALERGFEAKEKRMHFYGSDDFTLLYLDCRKNKSTDWWWGYHTIERSGDTYKYALTPTEKRVLSTIEWVVQTYDIDRNRIYLSGVSMGGSGSLGIGMCRGDLFAAINVLVPAGVEHMFYRLQDRTFPEPPPVINFSSYIDRWSKGQEDFLSFMERNKYLTIYHWSQFPHTNIATETDSVVLDFPWLDIVNNQAYPAFTNATKNQKYPGFKNTQSGDQKGQINAFFRWKNITDRPEAFEMELRLVSKDELKHVVDIPRESTTDITLRRLQRFRIREGVNYTWRMIRDGNVLQSGPVTCDDKGIITIRGVTVSGNPAVLTIEEN